MSYWYTNTELRSNYDHSWRVEVRHEVGPDDPRATLEGSRIRFTDRHMPQIDLDVPHTYWASSTPGHGHLRITGLSLSWRQYKRLLRALKKAGVIQEGWYDAARQNRQTFLRLKHIKKPDAPKEMMRADACAQHCVQLEAEVLGWKPNA